MYGVLSVGGEEHGILTVAGGGDFPRGADGQCSLSTCCCASLPRCIRCLLNNCQQLTPGWCCPHLLYGCAAPSQVSWPLCWRRRCSAASCSPPSQSESHKRVGHKRGGHKCGTGRVCCVLETSHHRMQPRSYTHAAHMLRALQDAMLARRSPVHDLSRLGWGCVCVSNSTDSRTQQGTPTVLCPESSYIPTLFPHLSPHLQIHAHLGRHPP